MEQKEAKLINNISIDHPDGRTITLTPRTKLIYLHKNKNDYWFCVKRLHGSGASGISLKRNEFNWKSVIKK